MATMKNLSNEITSNAFNFGECYRTGVDETTGNYNLSVTLGTLQGVGDLKFDLVIGYNPFNSDDTGFGQGWALNTSRYDVKNKNLILSDGSRFRVEISPSGRLTTRYFKEKNIALTLEDRLLVVFHKDGQIEKFDKDGHLTTIIAPTGHALEFRYKQDLLETITDSTGKTLAIKYSRSGFTVIGTDDTEACGSQIQSGRLRRIRLDDDHELSMTYKVINGVSCIEEVTHPSGKKEKLFYDSNAHRLPGGGPIKALPAVVACEIYEEGVKNKVTEYEYSKSNYLGNGLPRFKKGYDILFELDEDYQYSCTVKTSRDIRVVHYNRFHLKVRETIHERATKQLIKDVEYDYYADVNSNFSQQPNQYNEQRAERVTVYNPQGESRSYTLTTERDEHGNITRENDEYGITTQYEYYSKHDLGLSDRDQYIPSLIKTKHVRASQKYARGTEQSYLTSYRYEKISNIDGSGFFFKEKSENISTADGLTILQINSSWHTNSGDLHTFGREKTKTFSGHSRIMSESFHYSVNNDRFTLRTNRIHRDGLSSVESRTHSIHTGLKLSETDRQGNTTDYQYDHLKRVIRETQNSSTEYQRTTEYKYTAKDSIFEKHFNGNLIERIDYDQQGRQSKIYKRDADDRLRLFEIRQYDEFDTQVKTTKVENFGSGDVASSAYHSVDVWGNSRTTYRTGKVEVSEVDSVSRTVVEYILEGQTKKYLTTSVKNEHDDAVSVRSGSMSEQTSYDGFGKKVEIINSDDCRTIFTLDALTRPVRQRIIGQSEIDYTFEYDPHSDDESVTAIRVNGVLTGGRRYDSLGRIVSESKSGTTSLYQYETLTDIASRIVKPDGQAIINTIDPRLNQIVGVDADDTAGSFIYRKDNGHLLRESNEYCSVERTFTINGSVSSETQHGRGATYRYSAQGRLLTYIDFFGCQEHRSYNEHHLLSRIDGENYAVDLTYDIYGRVKTEQLQSKVNDAVIVHEYSYSDDHFGKISRKLSRFNSDYQMTQSYEYDSAGQVMIKQIVDSDKNTVTETYEYNQFKKLITHTVTGNLKPSFEKVGVINEQHFEYDNFSNIIRVVTDFMDSNGVRQQDEARYEYSQTFQLINISHSYSGLSAKHFVYDNNGCLERDSHVGYNYDAFDRMSHVSNGDGQPLISYQYTTGGQQSKQVYANQPPLQLYYSLGTLMHEEQGDFHTKNIIINGKQLGRVVYGKGTALVDFSIVDDKGSQLVHIATSSGKKTLLSYSSYGFCSSL